ncbi:MAG: hypothetical protein MRK01_17125 [Candidatus Scalindua sp.]|nr:hypothetical protein [Candidatus Scalindua sp.]
MLTGKREPGDGSLFIRQDEVEAARKLVDGVLDGWMKKILPIFIFTGPVHGSALCCR